MEKGASWHPTYRAMLSGGDWKKARASSPRARRPSRDPDQDADPEAAQGAGGVAIEAEHQLPTPVVLQPAGLAENVPDLEIDGRPARIKPHVPIS